MNRLERHSAFRNLTSEEERREIFEAYQVWCLALPLPLPLPHELLLVSWGLRIDLVGDDFPFGMSVNACCPPHVTPAR